MVHKEMGSDIDYVKDLVKRSEREPSPSSIYLLWAALVLIGFTLVDFAPEKVAYFWCIAGPLGGVASALLGRRAGLTGGQIQREVGIRHALHWGGMLVLIGLAISLPATGRVPWEEVSRIILLVVTFGWWCAGVHFDRVFLWLGGLMALGFVGTLVIPAYSWTALGVAIAIALVVAAFLGGRRREVQAR